MNDSVCKDYGELRSEDGHLAVFVDGKELRGVRSITAGQNRPGLAIVKVELTCRIAKTKIEPETADTE